MPEIPNPIWLIGLIGLASYALGSIPFGVVITRLMGLGDLRQIGSGNIGATNVMRTGNKLAGALTFLLDAGKGAIAVGLAWGLVGEDAAQVAGLAAFLGHLYPVYAGFKGGKGVATFIGTILALAWPVGLVTCLIWALVFRLSRISSLSALVASASSPILAYALGFSTLIVLLCCLTLLIFLKHLDNIQRMIAGTEPRFKSRK